MPAKNKERLGIYFGLPEDEYHADSALGSSRVIKLKRSPYDFWYDSDMNPMRPKRRGTEATVYGHAVHKLVLEGGQAFEAIYSRRPDDPETPMSARELKNARTKITKMHNQECDAAGMVGLHGDDWDRAMVCSRMITLDPDLAEVFIGAFTEVSIFWEQKVQGRYVRCKMRADILKSRGLGDVKNVSNPYRIEFKRACWQAMARYRMDMQAELYLRGRAALPDLVTAGHVHGDHDKKLLARICASKEFGWQWIFYPRDPESAPQIFSETLSPVLDEMGDYANAILRKGKIDVDVALERFVDCCLKYGREPWIEHRPVREADISNLPLWYGMDGED